MERQELIQKINQLPPESLSQVERLVDSLTTGPESPERKARREAIAEFAARYAGTEFDLDEELEAAGIEHLLETVDP